MVEINYIFIVSAQLDGHLLLNVCLRVGLLTVHVGVLERQLFEVT